MEVAVLGSSSLTVLLVSADVKHSGRRSWFRGDESAGRFGLALLWPPYTVGGTSRTKRKNPESKN